MTEKKCFMDPLEVPGIEGTEGWEEMYNYYHLFNREDPARIADESSRFWFRASIHLPDPLYPLDSNLSCDLHYGGVSALANRTLRIPVLRGLDFRVLNGHVYLHSIEVNSPEEREQRAQVFGPRINYVLQNWREYYRDVFGGSESLIEEMKQLQFSELLELEPESVVPELHQRFPVAQMYREYLKFWDILVRMGQQTLKALLPSYGGYLVFIENMRKLFPGIPDKAISQMIQGFESKLFRPVEELQKLAQLAVDTQVTEQLLQAGTYEAAAAALAQTAAGQAWIEQFEAARDPWFEITTGEGWQKQSISWNDNLDVPLVSIKNYIQALQAGEVITRPKEAVLRERDRVTREYRGLIQNKEDVEGFERLVELTRSLAPASEDHNIYHGSFFHSLYDRKIRRMGRLLVQHGIIQQSEDVFLLNRHDLDSCIWEIYTSWSRGLEPAGRYHWPKKIKRRKEIMARFKGWVSPPALGPVPDAVRNPLAIVHFGITEERIQSWLEADEATGEALKELVGFPGSSGVVQGVARVCSNIEDVGTLQRGEILVTQSTAPTWAPAFQAAAGCVTDMGGVFCHAAIVAREYGLPAVVGTGYATIRINTGDRIMIDGGTGVVKILEA